MEQQHQLPFDIERARALGDEVMLNLYLTRALPALRSGNQLAFRAAQEEGRLIADIIDNFPPFGGFRVFTKPVIFYTPQVADLYAKHGAKVNAWNHPLGSVFVVPDDRIFLGSPDTINRFTCACGKCRPIENPRTYFDRTALHELAHWAGAKTRLNRKVPGQGIGSNRDQALEEVIAETSAIRLMRSYGASNPEIEGVASRYIDGHTKDDPALVQEAERFVSETMDYLLRSSK